MWFLNLFIVLEPSLNIECEFVFLFVSSVEKKKREVRPFQKKVPAITKKKEKACRIEYCSPLFLFFCFAERS